MLGVMRKYQKSIIIKIMFTLIILSFVIGFVFIIMGRDEWGQSSTDYAVKVNGTKITFQELDQSYERIRRMFGTTLTPEQEKMLGIKKLALDTLIDAAVIRNEAKHMGLKISKDEIASEIGKIPAFQRDGQFNFEQYQLVLRSARTTPDAFEKSFREDLLMSKARKAVEDKVTVSDDEALKAYKKQRDRVNLVYTSYAPSDVKAEIKITKQDLEDYLKQHEAQYKTPEQVSISYVLVDPSSVVSGLTLSAAEATEFYQKNMDRYRSNGEILSYEQVTDRVKSDALKAKAAKVAYERAAEAVNKNAKTGNIQAVAQMVGTSVASTPFFTANNAPAPLAGDQELIARAFMLKPQEIAGPVETKRGIFIIALKERKPSVVPALELIKPALERAIAEEKGRELAKKKAEDVQAQLAKGSTAGISLQETGPFGFAASGDIPKIGKAPQVMEAAFSLTTAAPSPNAPIQIGSRWIAFKLKDRIEGSTADFQNAKEQIKQLMLPQKQKEAMEQWLGELKKKAKIKVNPVLERD